HYGQRWSLGLYWPAGRLNADGQQRLLDTLVRQTHSTTQTSRFSPLEIVQKRIEQVQAATDRLRSMRRFIQDSLAQMADGVIVTNNLGRVLLANPKAVAYL
ncbi:MAG: histidine kinase, partial [Candidatus Competibacteraceae bacterium]|nr:histidine kinase [Candidatus Competibacteraceae bacterium]